MLYDKARLIAERYIEILRPFAKRIEVAGSIRRECSDIGDIEIVMIRDTAKLLDLKETVDSWNFVKGHATGKYCARMLPEGINLDLFFASPENWANIFTIRTGSADWVKNVLARRWSNMGYVSEGGILHRITNCEGELGEAVIVKDERELFDFLGLKWVEPKDRK